jgi:transposase
VESLIVTVEEREQLSALARSTRDAKTAKRIMVILALATGYTHQQVAELFLLSEQTVAKWRHRYERRTLFSDWLATRAKGSKGKLTRAQKREVKEFVQAGTISDAQVVVDFISDAYGVTLTVNGVTKLLHRLGFVYKSTTLVPGKLDEEAQAAFVEEVKELRDNLPEDEVILYGDAAHPQWNVHATRAWVLRGEEKQIKTNAGRDHLNINGALNVASMRVTTLFTPPRSGVNHEEVIKWFDAIQDEYVAVTRIHLVLDNARYYKKAWRLYEARDDCRIVVHWLPAYSPNLNLVERLWRFLHRDIIGVKRRETLAEFESDVKEFFDNFEDYETVLRKFIGTEPHLISINA